MIMYSLLWLPKVLKEAGLVVTVEPGWETRGHGDMGKVKGVLCHHTGGPLGHGCAPSLTTVEQGRPNLPGPLAQLLLGRDGAYHIVAAGLAYHAGKGEWKGIKTGNSSFIGIEAENTGTENDPWPAVQMEAYVKGVAALLNHIGSTADYAVGHREYALPHGRKIDPDFDMDTFRKQVADIMEHLDEPD